MPTYSYENKTYTLSELRFLFPTVSFPAFPSEADLAPFGVTLVPDPEPTPEVVVQTLCRGGKGRTFSVFARF